MILISTRKLRPIFLLPIAAIIFATFIDPVPAAGPWAPLVTTIHRQLNPGNRAIGQVTLIQGDIAILRLYAPVAIGTTLAVKGNRLPGVPLPLQDNIATLKLTQVAGLQARGTILPGSRPIPPRAPLFPLTHNRVYLYTNLATPQNLRSFQDLVRTLQYNRIVYTIKNSQQLAAPDIPGIRPLIITFEATGPRITCRLTDREHNIYFENSFTLGYIPPVINQPGSFSAPGATTAASSFSNAPAGSVSRTTSFTQAHGPAPGTIPVGRIKLKNSYERLVFLEYDGKPGLELALLNHKWVEIYRLKGLKLLSLGHYRLPHNNIIPLHLHAGDFNHNGRDELYVSLGRPKIIDDKQDTGLYSLILENQGGKLSLLKNNLPYYFRVIEIRNGKKVLMVQQMGEYAQYQEPIRWAGFFQGKFAVRKPFHLAHDVYSLYNFNLNPFHKERILVLDEQGNIAGFNAKTSEKITTANENYGVFDETPFQQKLKEVIYEGGFTITKTSIVRFAARRFILSNRYGRQIFLIKKRRIVNPELKDKAIAIITSNDNAKTDQIIGLQWRGDEIRESWKSPRFARDVIDFGFTRIKGQETMVVLTRNVDQQYALELLH